MASIFKNFSAVVVLALPLLFTDLVSAEPWVSNRYAQNCAACHAPGRLNRPTSERRCTLSCQGCHVNPQGGGMRNQYGIWNQQRWLRSMRTEAFGDKPTPAPLQRQPYYERMRQLASRATEYYGGRQPQAEKAPRAVTKKKARAKSEGSTQAQTEARADNLAPMSKDDIHEGSDIGWLRDISPPEKYFDQHSYSEWRAVIDSEQDFLSVVPKGDPYRLERSMNVYASGDLRYFAINATKASQDFKSRLGEQDQRIWFMGADIGVRLRPIANHKLSGVVEARFSGLPTEGDPEDGFAQGAIAKSAYVLVDDLAYNSFFQAGLYRPMFGHYDPDHNSLSSEISGLKWNATFNAVAVGTAPNVPFFIVNYLRPRKPTGGEYQASSGFSATAGARFVSYGASVALSYWDTSWTEASGTERTRSMYALTGGATYKDIIANFEFLKAELAADNGEKNAGAVTTVQLKYRAWNEVYLVANFAASNVGPSLGEGSGSETTLGVKSFLMSNFELETLYMMRKLDELGVDKSYNLVQIQAHVFF